MDTRERILPHELRPAEIIEMYWRTQIIIEEDAEMLPPIYLQEAA